MVTIFSPAPMARVAIRHRPCSPAYKKGRTRKLHVSRMVGSGATPVAVSMLTSRIRSAEAHHCWRTSRLDRRRDLQANRESWRSRGRHPLPRTAPRPLGEMDLPCDERAPLRYPSPATRPRGASSENAYSFEESTRDTHRINSREISCRVHRIYRSIHISRCE